MMAEPKDDRLKRFTISDEVDTLVLRDKDGNVLTPEALAARKAKKEKKDE